MSFLGELARNTSEAGTTTLVLSPTFTAPVGSTILIAIVSGHASPGGVSNDAPFTATDTKSNTYADVSTSPSSHILRSGATQTSFLRTDVTAAIDSGGSITIAHGGNSSQLWTAVALVFDDVGALDTAVAPVGGTGGSTTSFNAGSTGAGSQPAQLVVGVYGFSGNPQTWTPGAGQSGTINTVGTAPTGRNVAVSWQYVNAPGTRSTSGTVTSGSVWVGGTYVFNSVVQPQIGVPSATRTGGVVTPSGMASHLAVADLDPASYDESTASPVSEIHEWGPLTHPDGSPLQKPVDLSQTGTQKVEFRAMISRATAASGSAVFKIREGTTIRATSGTINVTGQKVWLSFVPTSANLNAITDWTNLYLQIVETAA